MRTELPDICQLPRAMLKESQGGHLSHFTVLAELVPIFLGVLGVAARLPMPIHPPLSLVFFNTQVRELPTLLVVETCQVLLTVRGHHHRVFWPVTFEKKQTTSPRKKVLDTLQDLANPLPPLP